MPLGGATSDQLSELAWLCSNAVYQSSTHAIALELLAGIEGVHVAGIGPREPYVFLRARWRNFAVVAFRGTDVSIDDLRKDLNTSLMCWHVPVGGGRVTRCPTNGHNHNERCTHNYRAEFRTGAGDYNCVALHGGFRRRANQCPFHVADLVGSTTATSCDYGEGGSAPEFLLVCGHSLGGAAAIAYTFEALLRERITPDRVSCITFSGLMGIDRVGAQVGRASGFEDVFTTFVNNGDTLPTLAVRYSRGIPATFTEWGHYMGRPNEAFEFRQWSHGRAEHMPTSPPWLVGIRHTLANYVPTRRLSTVVAGLSFLEECKTMTVFAVAMPLTTASMRFHSFFSTLEGPGGDGLSRAHDYHDVTGHVPGVYQLPTKRHRSLRWSGAPCHRQTHDDPDTVLGMRKGSSTKTAKESHLFRTKTDCSVATYYLASDPDKPRDATRVVRAWLVVVEHSECAYRVGQVVAKGGKDHGHVIGARPLSLLRPGACGVPADVHPPTGLWSVGMPRGDHTLTAVVTSLWRHPGGMRYYFGHDREERATEKVTAWLIVVDNKACRRKRGDVVAKGGPRHGKCVGHLWHVEGVPTVREEDPRHRNGLLNEDDHDNHDHGNEEVTPAAGAGRVAAVATAAPHPQPVPVGARQQGLEAFRRLFAAARRGEAAGVRELVGNLRRMGQLEQWIDSTTTTRNGDTALTAAARFRNVEAVVALLSGGADVAKSNTSTGETALQLAARNGDNDSIEAILLQLAEEPRRRRVTVINPTTGELPLTAAARGGHTRAVRRLLMAGADVDGAGDGTLTPLIAAAEASHRETVDALITAGATVLLRDGQGRTAKQAAGRNHIKGALINAELRSWEPLWVPTTRALARPLVRAVLFYALLVATVSRFVDGWELPDATDPCVRAGRAVGSALSATVGLPLHVIGAAMYFPMWPLVYLVNESMLAGHMGAIGVIIKWLVVGAVACLVAMMAFLEALAGVFRPCCKRNAGGDFYCLKVLTGSLGALLAVPDFCITVAEDFLRQRLADIRASSTTPMISIFVLYAGVAVGFVFAVKGVSMTSVRDDIAACPELVGSSAVGAVAREFAGSWAWMSAAVHLQYAQ